MPKKPNSHGMQEYVPKGNGDASGEYADDGGNNYHFTNFSEPDDSFKNKFFKYFKGIMPMQQREDEDREGIQKIVDWGKQNEVNIDSRAQYGTKQNIKSLQQIKNLKNQFNVGKIDIIEDTITDNKATTFYDPINNTLQLGLDITFFGSSDLFESTMLNYRDSKWAAQFEDDKADEYIVTHEFGHILEYTWLIDNNFSEIAQRIYDEENGKSDFKRRFTDRINEQKYELFEKPFLKEVFKTAQKYDSTIKDFNGDIEQAPFVSRYAKHGWDEYIAEAFANGMLGRPTAIGKAVVETVKKWNRRK